MKPNFKRTRLACFTAYFTMSSIFSLPPLLFVTFRETYGISYTLLGTLVLINFCTQLGIDLLFTAFSDKFPIKTIVRVMPCITSLGLLIYALVPTFFPQFAYAGFVIGTVIFSVSAGLSEVLLSPTIAAMPSKNPQRDMSMLHSLYAFGVLFVVIVTTVFFKLFGTQHWMLLTVFFALLPLIAAVLFAISPMPEFSHSDEAAGGTAGTKKRGLGLALCVACIFLGSCAENTMSNWVSGFMENALYIDKAVGDILGLAAFALLLGAMRIGYAKWGKDIRPVLLFGMLGAAICYLTVAVSGNVAVTMIACMLTGLFTSMLWPGMLIFMEEHIPHAGVAAFALMAAGGDLGASVAPQLMGIVVDTVSASGWAAELGASLQLTAEQVGMKTGMLVSALFPLLGLILVAGAIRYFKKAANAGKDAE